MTEEMWNKLGHDKTIATEPWPLYDEEKCRENEFDIGVQVNGKLRATIKVLETDTEDDIKEKALSEQNVIKHLEGKEIIKVIVIPKRIVSIVVK